MKPLRAEKALFWILVAVLLWLPVPLGSNRVWAWSFMEVAIFGVLASWAVLWAMGLAYTTSPARRAWAPVALLLLYAAHQAFTLIPLPAAWVQALSPEAYRVHAMAGIAGVPTDRMTLSLDTYATQEMVLKTLAYTALFWLVLVLANNRDRVKRLAQALVYGAVLQSTYAVLMHLADVNDEHFGTMINHGASASGTFVNRNHLAGYLEMTLAIGIGLLIAGLSDRRADTWTKFFAHLLEWMLSPKMLLRLALCVLVIALTTTHSRMGNTAFFSSLLVAGVIGIALSRHATRNTVILLASLVVIDLLLVGSWFGVEKLAQRLEQTTTQEVREREDPAKYAVDLVRDYPLFGAGPGSFYAAFPRYRPESIASFFDFAHNDYAQIAAESGVVGLGILGLVVVLTLVVALRAQWERRDPLMRGMSFASLMGIVALLIHSWVDFNLQIPANAAYFMVVLALGWIAFNLDRRASGDMPVRG
jgi:O-antigen ligase